MHESPSDSGPEEKKTAMKDIFGPLGRWECGLFIGQF
jgi:hypothetical protein